MTPGGELNLDAVSRLRAAGCVFADEEAALIEEAASGDRTRAEELLVARIAGEPLEYLLGWVEFYGRRLRVAPGVFVPRRRTELLAELALELLVKCDESQDAAPQPPRSTRPRAAGREYHDRLSRTHNSRAEMPSSSRHLLGTVLELCCGVAPLASTIAALTGVRVVASDIDPDAARLARINMFGARQGSYQGGDGVYQGDLFAALPPELHGHCSIVVANAPYVPSDEIAFMPHEAREHEHHIALDGGRDGLDLHRRIVAGASKWLTPHGALILETSRHQAAETIRICEGGGFRTSVRRDDNRDATAVLAVRTPAP